jgi:hypothetical protein
VPLRPNEEDARLGRYVPDRLGFGSGIAGSGRLIPGLLRELAASPSSYGHQVLSMGARHELECSKGFAFPRHKEGHPRTRDIRMYYIPIRNGELV